MMSLECIEQEKREKDPENFPSTSTKSEEGDMALSTDETPHDTATITERVPYDVAHPPPQKYQRVQILRKVLKFPKLIKALYHLLPPLQMSISDNQV